MRLLDTLRLRLFYPDASFFFFLPDYTGGQITRGDSSEKLAGFEKAYSVVLVSPLLAESRAAPQYPFFEFAASFLVML